ncbi:anti-sigma factor family protein [Streptomyces himalayensis]|uniref:Zf-HC2 domain-containing protein n=1 Tax=Streptomyces himalayensis subsp. himalayensis TaxID=2756131 RepID=A0A7W0I6X0_9ACTN|nr:zf-HC2 domain-containing protein [Streptomyces himalayensis]MBA2944361.1 zf-HC2 domain-containing protein [Streptomyces himalayensis subsp. himalayensis]
MSGSRPTPAEQHLGDRLAALVDGELGHDARERVLAHLATCPKCKAEADAQRRLKNVFAEAAPPPPSETFLARLQGLPGGDDSEGDPFGGGGLGGNGVFGVRQGASFRYVPSAGHAGVLPGEDRGFRIHDVGRHDSRSASRGRRFAFAAAGAVSLAAIALGGVSAGEPAGTADPRGGSGPGPNVTPVRTQSAGVVGAPDSLRRRNNGPLLGQGQRLGGALSGPVDSTGIGAPLLPGPPSPAFGTGLGTGQTLYPLMAPLMAGGAVMSPLIRPVPPALMVTADAPAALMGPTSPVWELAATPVPAPSSTGTPTSPLG